MYINIHEKLRKKKFFFEKKFQYINIHKFFFKKKNFFVGIPRGNINKNYFFLVNFSPSLGKIFEFFGDLPKN